jgi:peptide/nickel transport system substrate-binding protein
MDGISRREVLAGMSGAALALGLPSGLARAQSRGGTIIIAVATDPNPIVPFQATDTGIYNVATNLFSTMTTLKMDFSVRANLADSWEVSPDGKSLKFTLNPKAKWHDGKPVTAADVEYSFTEIVGKYHPTRAAWWPNIQQAAATSDHVFELHLHEPFPPLLTLLSFPQGSGTFIQPKHIYAGTDPLKNPNNDHPIGSGPFRFVRWVKGSHVELERAPDFYAPGRPFLDKIIVQYIPDPATRILALERGEVDFIDYTAVPHNEIKRFEHDPKFKVIRGNDGAAMIGFVYINHSHPALKDKRVRQALYYGIDHQQIADKALFGAGRVAKSFMSSNLKQFYDPAPFVYKRDVAKANALLDAAGFARGTDGVRFRLGCLWASGRSYDGKSAELLRDHLRDVGIAVDVGTMDRPSLIERVQKRSEFDLAMQLVITGPDPATSLFSRFHSSTRNTYTNPGGYGNPKLDAIFEADRHELDFAKRVMLWKQAQAFMMDDLPALPLWEFPDANLSTARLHDAVTGPFGSVQSRYDAYLS